MMQHIKKAVSVGDVLLCVALIGLIIVASGATTAYGEDPLVQKTVRIAPNMEPVIPHPEQAAEAKKKIEALQKKAGKRPNILIYLMDDVGWGDLGAYGGGHMAGAPTPNMDRLAREGLQLTSAYAQPSCSPTRATIMTGRLPIRHGILHPPMYGEPGGLGGEITMASILSKAGYITQAVGKWHMGENEESHPQNVGFDDFYGFLSVSDMYTEWRDPYFFPEVVYSKERTEMIKSWPWNRNLVHAKKGGKVESVEEITIPVLSMLDEKWADYSVKFIKKMAKSDKPFLLYHCTRGGHFDNYPNDKYKGRSPAKYPYKDVMIEMDDILGRLVKTLEETGQLDNTLIFVTSDNGPEMETWPDSAYTPFRGAKGSTWEGGVRVPGIVYWRGMIKPGRISDGIFDLADLFNTSLNLAGANDQMPKDRFIDGIDQTSFLLADKGESNRKAVYYWLNQFPSGIRIGEYKYMLAAENDNVQDTVTPGGFSGEMMRYSYGRLFNLYLDPKENHSYLIRKLPYVEFLTGYLKGHLATLQKYPPKVTTKTLSPVPQKH
ncbi:MAG TPA: arylsulfatase [Syntrophorhabdaceae bacterium]|nr:arylsulfatase [Syntrophorhabdaceae bacterium]HNT68620.1 arylsulfatase [Syntrophorhabdaceae bacterium]